MAYATSLRRLLFVMRRSIPDREFFSLRRECKLSAVNAAQLQSEFH
jgi:hypothetical protein